jgi:hypothetical protein
LWKITLLTTAAMFVLAGLVLFARADDAAMTSQPAPGARTPYGEHALYRVGSRADIRFDQTA